MHIGDRKKNKLHKSNYDNSKIPITLKIQKTKFEFIAVN